MNRRTFIKYLSCAPIALATLLTRPLTASVSPEKEKDEELGAVNNNWPNWYIFNKSISQEKQEKILKALRMELKNHKFQKSKELGCQKEEKLQWTSLMVSEGDWYESHDGIKWTKLNFPTK